MSTLAEAHGFVEPGFEAVREAFERNFAEESEVGAAFAAYLHGNPVVDLWGGVADSLSGRPWERDTLQMIASGTKALVAVCVLLLLQRCELDLDAPVADYWPEFAANEKDGILVRDVVSHTARLPGIEAPTRLEDLTDAQHMADVLAAQAPNRDPRARLCYHVLTYGWLSAELIRRVDGRTIGEFFADEVAGPLDLELWIGLPAEEEGRVARLELHPDWPTNRLLADEALLERDPLLRSIYANPRLLDRHHFPWNSSRFRLAQIPGANAIGSARSVARLFASLGRLLSPETIALAQTPLSEGYDPFKQPCRFGVGFMLQTHLMVFGPPLDGFGHDGAGGSVHGCWPSEHVGFSYAMNLMRDHHEPDPRPRALLHALHDSVKRLA